ncbi:hypothetical protein HPB51_025932 [Rhipicephalus microplus]|uniref:HTH CENPB-type domain-containing protein n=1 Tax=Rhipicephalus microplus TaxID=6941 RepID=A0A9J6EDV4_RHIMP|nr:hypothetical protein HPB51_025932 [Rhipicephalus microplus]
MKAASTVIRQCHGTPLLLWVVVRFFLLSTEMSVLIFGLAFGRCMPSHALAAPLTVFHVGHLDSRTSIQRVLMVTSFVAELYSGTQILNETVMMYMEDMARLFKRADPAAVAQEKKLPHLIGTFRLARAEEIVLRMDIALACSDGWLNRFRKPHGLVFRPLTGEATAVDKTTCNDLRLTKLKDVIQEHDLSDINNVDETALFYQMLPQKTSIRWQQ